MEQMQCPGSPPYDPEAPVPEGRTSEPGPRHPRAHRPSCSPRKPGRPERELTVPSLPPVQRAGCAVLGDGRHHTLHTAEHTPGPRGCCHRDSRRHRRKKHHAPGGVARIIENDVHKAKGTPGSARPDSEQPGGRREELSGRRPAGATVSVRCPVQYATARRAVEKGPAVL